MFSKMQPARLALVLVIFVFCCSGTLRAQTTNATVSGRVTDSSKGIVPGAKITLTNTGTNIRYEGTTNESGSYYVTDLLPGTYRMEVDKPGFTTVIKPDIVLHVQDNVELNFEMAVGSVEQSVTVEAGAPTVQLTESSISAVVNSTTVRELPLNGRSWTDLADLQPGVAAIETQMPFTTGGDRGTRGFGAQISISGGRPVQNNYRLDGISINDYANGGPGSVLGGNLGVDAVQEFSVLTSNYSTEYGRTSGGVVNAITRSGTNQLHGTVYEFLRNSALDAPNFFDNAGSITKPPFRRNQFGVAAGAPIKKDRTFVYGDFEGVRQNKGITLTSVVPSPAARTGNLSTGPVTVDPFMQKFLGLYPLPNAGLIAPGDVGRFVFGGQQVINENFVITRIDQKFSGKDALYGTYMYDDTAYSAPDRFDDVLSGHHTRRQLAAVQEEHVFTPSLVNVVRLGYSRDRASNYIGVAAINPLAADPSLGPGNGAFAPEVSVSGLENFKGGVNAPSHFIFVFNSSQGYDDASLSHGTHFLKFGAAFERIDFYDFSLASGSGQFTFGSLSKFLTNQPKSFLGGLTQNFPRGLRQNVFGVYVQDDWRWRPSVTLNLGLRYEIASVPTEVHNVLVNLQNLTDAAPHIGKPWFHNPTLRNFEPRVGFAWDATHDAKTAVRGGFGVFDVLPLPYQFILLGGSGYPFSQRGSASNLPQGSFPVGAQAFLTSSAKQDGHIEPNPKRDYVMQWNLTVQRQLTSNLTALASYVGSRGVHQPFIDEDVNDVLPTLTSAGYVWPSPLGTGTKLNPGFGSIRSILYGSSSFYNALELGVEKRMSHGVQFQTSYTWGKSIDDSSASVVGDNWSNSIASPPDFFDMRMNRAVSDFNIGRTLVVNTTWLVPEVKSLSGLAARLVNGWELGAIYKVSDGVPFTATFGTGGDPVGLLNHDDWAFPNRLVGPGCSSLINPGNTTNYIKTECFDLPKAPSMAFWNANCDQTSLVYGPNGTTEPFPVCFNLRGNSGRNIMTGPGLSNLDFSLFKNNYIRGISESFNIQFRWEVFNILNRANFALPVTPDNTDIFDSSGTPTGVAGLLTSTVTDSRQMQFALKVIW